MSRMGMIKIPHHRWPSFACSLALFALGFHESKAASFNVANGDVAALKAAITTANSNGQVNTINLASGGTYTLTTVDANNTGLPRINSASGHLLTINGNNATILRSTANGTPAFRIFEIMTDARIVSLTVANGRAPSNAGGGGAILSSANNLSVERCTFQGNLAVTRTNAGPAGGAVKNTAGTLTVQECLFDSNVAELERFPDDFVIGRGGGAIANSATLVVSDTTFQGQSIRSGFNAPTGLGGAIYNGSSASFARCSFINNTASAGGGAIESFGGPLTISNSYFGENVVDLPEGIHNIAAPNGGAIECSGALTTVTNCTFSRNRTSDSGTYGGAIYHHGTSTGHSQLNVTSCTFSRSSGGAPGASIYNWAGSTVGGGTATVALRNTILDRFRNTTAQHLGNTGTNALITSSGYNISDDSGGGFLTGPADQINTEPMADTLPQANGGPTLTIALPPDSPAIDKGKAFSSTQDQRGVVRPTDLGAYPNASGGDGSDIGAFEVLDPAQAGPTYVVNTTTDHDDGTCGTYDCTLRDAIVAANAASSAPTITFASNVTGTIPLAPTLGRLVVSRSMTITGPGARVLAVSGNGQSRVFNFAGGPTVVSGLTIRSGVIFSGLAPALGGGLTNVGTLTINDCALVGNAAYGSDATSAGATGGSAFGGAAHNAFGGSLTFNRCTFANNAVDGGFGAANSGFATGGAGGAAQGAAIYNDSNSTAALNNCTLANNTASGGNGGSNTSGLGGNGGSAKGAGIFNRGTLTLTACTLRGNNATGGAGGQGSSAPNHGIAGTGAGGVTNDSGASATLRNNLIADNSGNAGTDANGSAFTSAGYNLIRIGDFGSGFNGPADQVGTSAAPIIGSLGPLQNNGGPTDTIAPLAGSPALDRGKSFGLTTDQRGIGRPDDNPAITNATGGDGSDIGAYEQLGVLIVNTLADHNDGLCSPVDCTLREAITTANATPGSEVIAFRPGLNGTIQLTGPLPILSTSLSIMGPGKDVITVRRSTGGEYRIFTIGNGTASGPLISISRLTITNGHPPNIIPNSGGGILNDRSTLSLSACAITGNSTPEGSGGGLSNDKGNTTVENCSFSNNTASDGGAVANYFGQLTIRTSTLSGNEAYTGGAAINFADSVGAELRLTNSTVSGNTAPGRGGGVYNVGLSSPAANAYIYNCTFSDNASPLGTVLYNQASSGSARIYLQNDIFKTTANGLNLVNSGGTITSNGYNLSNDNGGGFLIGTGDKLNTDPMLGPLQNNGGATFTHALLSGSPAIDQGVSNGLTTDQRGVGYLRIIDNPAIPPAAGGDNTDIGAYEFGASVAAASRKTHGSFVGEIDQPLTGTRGVECRSGGASNAHQVILKFGIPVTLTSASVTAAPGQTAEIAGSPISSADGKQVTLNLNNVSNAQTLTLKLLGVSDGTATNDVSVAIGVLFADSNGDGFVNSGDAQQTRNRSGQTANATNFRSDYNLDGTINSGDATVVRSRSGQFIP